MAKIQLYLAKVRNGYKSLVNFNPEEEIRRHIGDYSSAVAGVDYDPSEINIFYIVQYIESGTLLTIIRTIPDKRPDHLAATLFIGSHLDIASSTVLDIVSDTASRLTKSTLTSSDIADLRALYSTDYLEDKNTGERVPSEGRDFAWVRLGEGADADLSSLADEDFYQPAFTAYAGVIILGAEQTSSLPELGDTAFKGTFLLDPPQPQPQGFVPHIFHRVFDKPFTVAEDDIVEICWKRAGFEPVTETYTIDSPDFVVPLPDISHSLKSITPSSFYITAQKGSEQIPDCKITVNGKNIRDGVSFTYAELSSARVEIQAPGFFPFAGKMDLATTTQALVQLKEKHKSYRFEIPVEYESDAALEPARFTIHTRNEITQSPVRGYIVAADDIEEGMDHTNTLVYSPKVSTPNRYILIAVGVLCLLAGMLIGHYCFTPTAAQEEERVEHTGDGENTGAPVAADEVEEPADTYVGGGAVDTSMASSHTVSTETETPQNPENDLAAETDAEPAQETPAETSTQTNAPAVADSGDATAAVNYIDSHSSWKKSEMEAIPALQGLFDDMNNYRFDRLAGYWADKLSASRRFQVVAEHARGAKTKRDPRVGIHNPTYNRPGDEAIGWRGYINHIDP